MNGESRAAVLRAPGELSIDTLAVPEAPPDDGGLLDVEVCGVCGADVELFRGRTAVPFEPLVLGHEIVGRVREISAAAAARWGVAVGDRVAVNEVLPCGRCMLCTSGRGELCNGFFGTAGSRYGFLPLSVPPGLWGGFAGVLALHPHGAVFPVAEHVPSAVAAMFMPVANGVHWLFDIAGLRPGATVLVIGPGPQGLAVTAVGAAAAGLRIVVAGRPADADRLALARTVGAAATVDGDPAAVRAAVAELTGGAGVDAVIVATSGADDVLATATRCVRIGGTIVVAGTNGWRSEQRFKADALVFRDITLRGAPGHSIASVGAAVRLLARHPGAFAPLAGPRVSLESLRDVLDGRVSGRPGGGVHISVHP